VALFLPAPGEGLSLGGSGTRALVFIGSLVLFGGGALLALSRVFTTTPALVVTHEGIQIRGPLIGRGTIKWSEIRAVLIRRAPTGGTLRIVLVDQRSLRRRQNAAQALVRGLLVSSLVMTSDSVVGDSMLATSIVDFGHQVRGRYHKRLARHGILVSELRGA
jgi:hypothetical protein